MKNHNRIFILSTKEPEFFDVDFLTRLSEHDTLINNRYIMSFKTIALDLDVSIFNSNIRDWFNSREIPHQLKSEIYLDNSSLFCRHIVVVWLTFTNVDDAVLFKLIYGK